VKSNKEILKGSLPGLATSFVILLLILLFNPSFTFLVLLVTGFLISKALYQKRPINEAAGGILGVLIVLAVIKIFYTFFGSAGLWSLLAVVFFLAGVILWRARKQYLEVIRSIEKSYFGMTAEERKEYKNGRKRT